MQTQDLRYPLTLTQVNQEVIVLLAELKKKRKKKKKSYWLRIRIQLQIYKNEYNKFLQHIYNKLKCQSITTQNKIKRDYTKAYHNKVTNNKFVVKMS